MRTTNNKSKGVSSASLVLTALALALFAAGCGGGSGDTKAPAAKPAATASSAAKPAAAAAAAVRGSGSVRGSVAFAGQAPAARPIRMDADPVCAGLHTTPPVSQRVEVTDGKLAGALAYVIEGPVVGAAWPVSTDVAVLDQNGCIYSPSTIGVQVGQVLEIRNSDATLHNVHSVSEGSGGFNRAMPMKGQKMQKKFTEAEVFVRVKCDVHPWMAAWIGVVAHPFFAVTAADGSFAIEGLPAGSYVVRVAHPVLGAVDTKVEVADGAAAEVSVELSAQR